MHIVIGSLNPVKQQAARSVLAPLYPGATFEGVEAPSRVPAQPRGDQETRSGAINRARAALASTGADLAVGFESGLIETELGLMTCAWCAVIAPDGRLGVGGGSHMMLPPDVKPQIEEGMELGDVIDRLTGRRNSKHAEGAIGLLTVGLESRETAYAHTLRLALAPFRSSDRYTPPANGGEAAQERDR